ncbi:MAG: hypothetical protein ACYDBQ_08795 [Thermoplasmatota archaeon]
MRQSVLAAGLLLAVPLLSGCTTTNVTGAFGPDAFAAPHATGGRYVTGALVQAFAVDGTTTIGSAKENVLTGETSPFSFPASDSLPGDGQAPAWFRLYEASDANHHNGTLWVESFADAAPARERFVATQPTLPCPHTVAPRIDSVQAAKIAATDPGLEAAAKEAGQYLYRYLPPAPSPSPHGNAPNATASTRPAARPAGGCDGAGTWRIQFANLDDSRSNPTLYYFPAAYTVDVDAGSGAILATSQEGPRGHEVALSAEIQATVDAVAGVDVTIPFNVTLAGSRLVGVAGTYGAAPGVPQAGATFQLTAPDGKTYAPQDSGPGNLYANAFFTVPNAPAGAWRLTYHEAGPAVPGSITVNAHMLAILGENPPGA